MYVLGPHTYSHLVKMPGSCTFVFVCDKITSVDKRTER